MGGGGEGGGEGEGGGGDGDGGDGGGGVGLRYWLITLMCGCMIGVSDVYAGRRHMTYVPTGSCTWTPKLLLRKPPCEPGKVSGHDAVPSGTKKTVV